MDYDDMVSNHWQSEKGEDVLIGVQHQLCALWYALEL